MTAPLRYLLGKQTRGFGNVCVVCRALSSGLCAALSGADVQPVQPIAAGAIWAKLQAMYNRGHCSLVWDMVGLCCNVYVH